MLTHFKLKFQDTVKSKLYFTGCTHLNHDPKWNVPIWKLRGYNSAVECTDSIIAQINQTCRTTDVLCVLGDFCLNTSEQGVYDLLNRINPQLWFIKGNHPNPWYGMYHRWCMKNFGHEALDVAWLNKVRFLGDYFEMTWNKQKVVCNHFPMLVWNKMAHGVWSLVSHSHGSCSFTIPSATTGKQLDCGWDVWSSPIGFDTISNIMANKQIIQYDHHDRNT